MTTAQREKTLDEAAIDLERARRNARRVIDAEEQPPHPPLRALTLDELFQLPPPSYLIDQFIPALGLVQVVGEPGACKTFFMLHASLAIASGQKTFFGFPVVQHGPVLYIAAEGASALQFRVRAWCTAHDVDPLSLSDTFRVINMPVNFRDPTFQQELRAIVDDMHPILIVPDTRARCTPGADENSSKDMGEVVNFCSQLQQTGAAVAFIHHPTKKDPSGGGRGSGAFFGAVDTEIRLESTDAEDTLGDRQITVTCAKQKEDAPFPPLTLAGSVVPVCDLDGREMAYESGRAITSIVLRLATSDDAEKVAEAKKQQQREIDLRVLRVMQQHPEATSQTKIRTIVRLQQNVVADAIGRILTQKWAIEGDRGKPFQLTDLGRKQLEPPF